MPLAMAVGGGAGGSGLFQGTGGKGGVGGSGGALYNTATGTVSFSNGTIAGNLSGSGGPGGPGGPGILQGAGGNGGGGGGVLNLGSLTVTHGTMARNAAGSGGSSAITPGLSGTGGGIQSTGSFTITNSIIALNTGSPESDLAGSITAESSNNLTSGDPMLAPLGDYGGPLWTMLPLPGSPAIDSGGSTTLTTDQRGLARVVGSAPDIGAVELTLEEANSIVTSTADSGAGSLRRVISWAPAGTIITFDSTLSGQAIVLTSGQLTLSKNLTIDASGLERGITIDGNANGRIFECISGTTTVLEGLTLTNGLATGTSPANQGGAIYVNSAASLTLNNSTISGNSAGSGGGIFSYGTLVLTNSTLSGNSATSTAGGIYNWDGTITLNNSTLSGNSAGSAGGIYSYGGILTLYNSTLSGNSATNSGGGIRTFAGTITLNNSTLSDNSAGSSGGGVHNDSGTLNSTNSIIAGNTAPTDPDLSGITATGSNNLTSGDPMLAPLGDYGGPTQTMPPLIGSPAIDAGGTTTLTTDQRGLTRVVGSAADIGAVELNSGDVSFIVMSTVDSGPGSLRQAIALVSAGTTITFDNSLSGQTILLTSGQLSVSKNLTIDASALADGLTIDGNANGRIFEFFSGTNSALEGLILTNGLATGSSGGAIHVGSAATLTLNHSTLSGNTATLSGGAIANSGTLTLTLNNSTLSGNSSTSGGAIDNVGTITLNNSTLSGNTTTNTGGAIDNIGTLTLNNSTLSGNSAGSSGGGVHNDSGTLNSSNSIIAGNTASTDPDLSGITATGSNNLIDVDPQLAPLGDYGGPTRTMPPLPGSPAIDAGGTTTLTTDQRGLTRVVGSAADIGAVELNSGDVSSIVMSTVDSGPGSLRQAIALVSAGTTITFDNSLSGQTILLTSGQLSVSKNLTIDASALTNKIRLDGNANSRIFEFISATTSVLEGLILTSGLVNEGGGAIYLHANANLTINNCNLSGNSANWGGGIFCDRGGTLTLNNSTLSGNSAGLEGGGIYNNGESTLTLNNSKVSSNSAFEYGGGVYSFGGISSFHSSTISGNSATNGGGIYNFGGMFSFHSSTISSNSASGSGGGIGNRGTLTLSNSTLAENNAGQYGGGINNNGTLTLRNSTIAGNWTNGQGGGIFGDFDGTLNSINSIIANNLRMEPFPPFPSDYSGSIDSGSNNLIGDVLLAPLGDYGGPTQTVPPQPGSPAIDAGIDNGSLPTTDQRGLARVVGSAVDIGAVELTFGEANSIVTTTADSGFGSLRQMISSALPGDTITFDSSLSGQTILLTSGQLTVSKNLTIDASGLERGITIDGNANGRIFECTSGNTAVLEGLALTNGLATGGSPLNHGGAIYANSATTLTLNNSTISGNSASSGGGIFTHGTLVLNNSTLSGNSASSSGGGIYSYGGTVTLSNSTFSGNSAGWEGGGICNDVGTLTLNHSTLAGNSASANGGGIHTDGGALNISYSIVAGNTASTDPNMTGTITSGSNNLIIGDPQLAPLGNYGGVTQTRPPLPSSQAIDAGVGTGSMPTTDQRGLARVSGSSVDIGAVEIQTLTVLNASDSGPGSLRETVALAPNYSAINFAPNLSGQTILLTSGQITIGKSLTIDASSLADGLIIDGNANVGFSARIFEYTSATTNRLQCLTLTNSRAYDGGAILVGSNASLVLNQSTLSGNSADFNGGGIDNRGMLTINHSTLSGNSAANTGGGGINNSGSLTLNSSTISENSAELGGGIANEGALTLNYSTVSGNTATIAGGGIHSDFFLFDSHSSILAGNTAPTDPNFTSGNLTPGGNNLTSGDPKLAPLGDYGGRTHTMLPLSDSPAIDAGIDAGSLPDTDQRGLARVLSSALDIGAVEAGNPIPSVDYSVVTTASDSSISFEPERVSLRIAIEYAPDNSTITFASHLSGQTIVLTDGQLAVSQSLTIDASALHTGIIIDGNADFQISRRIFEFASGTTNVLEGLTLTNGLVFGSSSDGAGGAIFVNPTADLTLNHSTLSGNVAAIGGGITNYGTITLNDSTLSGNRAEFGGGIYNQGTLTLNRSTLSANSAGSGGGIANFFSPLTLNNSTLAGNDANEGGGIWNQGTLTLNYATLSNNSATSSGGGIDNMLGTLSSSHSIVAGNLAPTDPNLSGTLDSGSNNLTSGAPQLAPLGNYGGPTRTMPPLPGSPAIEGGVMLVGTTPLTDQLGNVRPSGPLPDIGAVEAFPLASAPGFVDTDSDGIDDRLETGVFGNLTTANATSDSDGDGSSDKNELANMTNPRDGNSLFKVMSLTPTVNFNPANNAEFEITFSTFPGLSYRLETSNTLSGFQPLPASNFTADGYSKTITVVLDDIRGFVRAARQD